MTGEMRSMDEDLAAPRWVARGEAPTWHASEILPGLFMGGTADHDVVHMAADRRFDFGRQRPYDAVVTLYAWAQPVSWEVEELRYGFGDGDLDCIDVARVLRAAQWAWDRWRSGDRVLIRCQAGLNRSGLVTALVLMLNGMAAEEAISIIRQRRSSWALCNRAFVDWLVDDEWKLELESTVRPLARGGVT
jgi:hypothetical protein